MFWPTTGWFVLVLEWTNQSTSPPSLTFPVPSLNREAREIGAFVLFEIPFRVGGSPLYGSVRDEAARRVREAIEAADTVDEPIPPTFPGAGRAWLNRLRKAADSGWRAGAT
jgi:hypothetical protein